MQFGMEPVDQPFLETALNSILSQQTHNHNHHQHHHHYASVHPTLSNANSNWQSEQSEEEDGYYPEYSTDFSSDLNWHLNTNHKDVHTIISYVLNTAEAQTCEDPYLQSYESMVDVDRCQANTTSTPRLAFQPKPIIEKPVYQQPIVPDQYSQVFDEWKYHDEPKKSLPSTSGLPFYDDSGLPRSMNRCEMKKEVVENDSREMLIKPTRPASTSRINPYLRKQHQREQDKNRTRTLNVAFCRLRSCLPEIPKDTKLTKIRTLRYAITYIRNLMEKIQEADSMTHVQTMNQLLCSNEPQTLFKMDSTDQSYLRDSGFDSYSEK